MKPTAHKPTRDAEAELPETLRWQLRGLRQDVQPGHDLWPAIAGRLQRTSPSAGPRLRHRLSPVALAASLLLAIGAVGLWGGLGIQGQSPERAVSLLQHEAAGMTRQFDAAYAEVTAMAPATQLQPALDELDHNTRLILEALARNPDSRLLLEQLRRTHAHRLALVQRAAFS